MDECVWSNGGIILTGETEVLGEILFRASVVVGLMRMEQWGKYSDIGKLKSWGKNIIEHRW